MGIVVNVKIEIIDLGCESAKGIYRMGEYYVTSFTTRLYDPRITKVGKIFVLSLCVRIVVSERNKYLW
jgi:hypothetical protein